MTSTIQRLPLGRNEIKVCHEMRSCLLFITSNAISNYFCLLVTHVWLKQLELLFRDRRCFVQMKQLKRLVVFNM